MAWPNLIARVYTVLSAAWATARAQVSAEIDQLIDMCNALLDEGQAQELRITANADAIADIESYSVGLRRGLKITQSTTSPQTDLLITCDLFGMGDGETVLENVSVLLDIGDAGAGGLDTGTAAADTLYHAHIAYDSTGVMSPDTIALASLSATAPTLPTGYDLSAPVSADGYASILTDSAAELVAFSHVPGQNMIRFYSAEDDGKTDPVTLTGDDEWRTMDLSSFVPTGAPGAWCMFRYDGDAGAADQSSQFYLRPTWSAIGAQGKTLQRLLFLADGAGDKRFGPFWIPLDEDGLCGYRCEGADAGGGFPPTLQIWVVGWQL